MIRRCLSAAVLALCIVPAWTASSRAQVPVANLASVVGTAEVQRGGKGEWQTVAIGSPVFAADAVRTGAGGFAKLVFVDEAVVDLGASSELGIERSTAKRARRSVLRLNQGGIEAWIGGSPEDEGRYEVETPTAVIRPQSTQFVVRYDPAEKATDVIGLEGTLQVQGTTGIIGPGVAVAPNESTRVPLDGFPSPVRVLDAAQLTSYTQGLRRLGSGGRDGLDNGNPIAEGRLVADSDRPSAALAATTTVAGGPLLKPGVPGQTLIDSLSPDIRANNQPLPVYRAVPPNASPNPVH